MTLSIKPIPFLGSLLSPSIFPSFLFPATWCVYGLSIHSRFSTSSFPLPHTCGSHTGHQLPTPFMNISRPLIPCIYAASFISFPVSQFHSSPPISFHLIPSASVSHPYCLPPLTNLFQYFSPPLHLSNRFLFNPVSQFLFSLFILSIAVIPVLMCTFLSVGPWGHHRILLRFLHS
ncbi:hypothetical protein BDM02DRAFT_2456955 [Thelephora ganbajun]|uniref:Uncharacterized protein n=1 Tax=Thelephora ganbajun TaxID=370292 RepID=A0ACB6ZED7_THEGA|nr:hypothetical protein BDM02DRAFT_2456955 [Thelephora ganbajun]